MDFITNLMFGATLDNINKIFMILTIIVGAMGYLGLLLKGLVFVAGRLRRTGEKPNGKKRA